MTRLLIIKPSSLGDIVHGLQVATSLKAQQPGLRVSWVVRDMFAPLVRACEAVDETFVFRRDGGMAGFLELTRALRQTKFDAVFDFQGLLRSGLMTWRVRAGLKAGRSDAREGAWFFYKQLAPLPSGGRHSHALEILLQFCPLLGAEPALRGALGFRTPENLNLNHLDGRGGARPIVMFPDSRRAEKRWGGFKRLSELIIRDGTGRRVVWAGNNYIPDKDAFPPAQFLNLTGNTSLVSLPALVGRADWVISNDSGPMHLAAALGVRTLGLFGPTDPQRFGPYPPNAPTNHVVQAPVGNLRLLAAREVYARFQRLDQDRPKPAPARPPL